jgi:O-antigen/teichoic acid export membrane protein
MASLIYSSISYVSKALGSIIVLAFCARFLTVDTFGEFSFAVLISTLLVILLDYGAPIRLPKDIAQDKKNFLSITSESFSQKIVLLIPFSGVSALVIVNSSEPILYFTVILAAVCYSFFCAFMLS